jgi:hypothetical protein
MRDISIEMTLNALKLEKGSGGGPELKTLGKTQTSGYRGG